MNDKKNVQYVELLWLLLYNASTFVGTHQLDFRFKLFTISTDVGKSVCQTHSVQIILVILKTDNKEDTKIHA